MKYLIICIYLIGLAHVSTAQYTIKLKVSQPKDSVVYLRGITFDNKNFIAKDTLRISSGSDVSISKKTIVGGLYYFLFPSNKERIYFTLQNKDSILFSFAGNNPLGTIRCNHKENNVFLDYQRREKELSVIDTLYAEELARGRKFNVTQKDGFFKEKRDTLVAVRNRLEPMLRKDGILAMHFTTLDALDKYLPQRSRPALREAFIEQFDLNMPRLLFTPHIHDVLNEYLSAFPLVADSIQKGMDKVMKKMNCTSKARDYILDYFISVMKNRNIQNNTKGITRLIEDNVIKSTCKLSNEQNKFTYLELYEKTRELNAHDTAMNMVLTDTSKSTMSLFEYSKQFDYTVIIFYAPTCEHCKTEVPLMDSTVNELEKKLKLKIGRYAVCNEPGVSDAVWKDFIKTYRLSPQCAHVMMSTDQKIRTFYNAYSTPQFFLINKQNKIIEKNISPTSLRRLGPMLLKQE